MLPKPHFALARRLREDPGAAADPQDLLQDQTVAIARSLAVDKARVTHDILMRALCYQLATNDQARQLR
jgi:type II secretory pathway predicted ATPase ExeA